MTSTFVNIFFFLLITFAYFQYLRPRPTVEGLTPDYFTSTYMYLGLYFAAVVLLELAMNTAQIASMCGGNVAGNIGQAAVMTLLPWTLLFGVMLVVVAAFPSLKSAFADVIGYYYISGSANRLLSDLFINTHDKGGVGVAGNVSNDAADMIMKIMGNPSLFMNYLTITNFSNIWDTVMGALMKPETRTPENKAALFDLVVSRENVGEAMWMVYGGVLLICLVQMRIATRGCVSNRQTMEKNYQTFLEQEKAAAAQKEAATSQVYTLSA